MRFAPGYRTRALMRRGGAVDVFEAWSEERGCVCIVKLLKRSRQHDARVRRKLRREASLLLSLSHPHIVRAYELIERPRMALVMETLPGETLSRIIRRRRRRRLGHRDLATLGQHLVSALSYLHGRGILHLDLKPSNIIVHGGITRIIDFDLARPPGRGVAGVGTDVYLAPEQARGGWLSTATDVFGLGSVLYKTATGTEPFRSNGARGYYEQLERRATPVATLRRLPARLTNLIDACLDPEPGRRPSLAHLTRELKRVRAE